MSPVKARLPSDQAPIEKAAPGVPGSLVLFVTVRAVPSTVRVQVVESRDRTRWCHLPSVTTTPEASIVQKPEFGLADFWAKPAASPAGVMPRPQLFDVSPLEATMTVLLPPGAVSARTQADIATVPMLLVTLALLDR